MSEMVLPLPPRKPALKLSQAEYAELNTIIDLLIPADDAFPPPSSLQLIDEFLYYLKPDTTYRTTLFFNEQRLRKALHDLNTSADGDFCKARPEAQQALLRQLEHRDPAFFQALWTLVTYSYYARLATLHFPFISQTG